MDRKAWNQRYRSVDLVWGTEPNRFVAEALGGREPAGRALDLACGEGRNAIWLARRGWRVTGVDLSDVAIERARKLAAAEGVEAEWVCADLTSYEPDPEAFALVVISYLQVPEDARRSVLSHAASALAPGGELFMIGHARRNLTEGVGGPRDPAVLWDPDEIRGDLQAAGLRVERCEEVPRAVNGGDGVLEAIDVLAAARAGPVSSDRHS
jgi:SAM-dependent methyltransferase